MTDSMEPEGQDERAEAMEKLSSRQDNRKVAVDDSVRVTKSDLDGWHRRLLPFMMGSLIVMGLLFFILTVWHFHELQSRLSMETVSIDRALEAVRTDPLIKDVASRDWYLRVVLEEAALRHRYQQNSAIVHTRAWTRYMGFLTGMILALTGCVFVLGKLREEVSVSGKAHGIEANLTTASPGIALALAGTLLVGISLWVPVTVESSDVPVYLPRQIMISQPLSAAEPGTNSVPSMLDPVLDLDTKRREEPVSVSKEPPLPESVLKRLKQDAEVKKTVAPPR